GPRPLDVPAVLLEEHAAPEPQQLREPGGRSAAGAGASGRGSRQARRALPARAEDDRRGRAVGLRGPRGAGRRDAREREGLQAPPERLRPARRGRDEGVAAAVMPFTRERIVAALRELGARAWSRGLTIDLAVYGGSCLALVSNFRVSTRDVDSVSLC